MRMSNTRINDILIKLIGGLLTILVAIGFNVCTRVRNLEINQAKIIAYFEIDHKEKPIISGILKHENTDYINQVYQDYQVVGKTQKN